MIRDGYFGEKVNLWRVRYRQHNSSEHMG